ncbi:hypothetical protein K3495_g809 [Podosphaera aphanis]|nr:hypothetical protein K3495_g809 [Podosphaera aphanis]
MENNPWDPEGAGMPHPEALPSHIDHFNDRDTLFIQSFPLLCSVPNQNLFLVAMQNGIQDVNAVQLSTEIMDLARSYLQLDKEILRHKNDNDTLLEKNQELVDTVTELQKQKKSSSRNSS